MTIGWHSLGFWPEFYRKVDNHPFHRKEEPCPGRDVQLHLHGHGGGARGQGGEDRGPARALRGLRQELRGASGQYSALDSGAATRCVNVVSACSRSSCLTPWKT